jgi:hypothetical protein
MLFAQPGEDQHHQHGPGEQDVMDPLHDYFVPFRKTR